VQFLPEAPGGSDAPRFLVAHGRDPALEFVESLLPRTARTPILFIHGAFGGAWIWTELFMRHVAKRGRPSAALSVRGHGRSDGRDVLRSATLTDYAKDVRRALAEFVEPPIIVAHSLGALLAQRLLGHVSMRAIIMLAPLPPEGLSILGPWLLLSRPTIWLDVLNAALGAVRYGQPAGAREGLISQRLSAQDARRYAALMVAEGPRVLSDAHLPLPVVSAAFLRIPALVIGAADDPLISRQTCRRTAAYDLADYLLAEDCGHMLPIEPVAESVADQVLDWLDHKGL
jgi:pimeloyl-ACP methyl ester carboxylesterase